MAPVKFVSVTTEPYIATRVKFAFVKFVADSAAVEPAAVAAAAVPNTRSVKSAPLTSTPGPNIRPAYSTYPDPPVNVGRLPAEATMDPDVLTPVSAAFVKSTPVISITLRKS